MDVRNNFLHFMLKSDEQCNFPCSQCCFWARLRASDGFSVAISTAVSHKHKLIESRISAPATWRGIGNKNRFNLYNVTVLAGSE